MHPGFLAFSVEEPVLEVSLVPVSIHHLGSGFRVSGLGFISHKVFLKSFCRSQFPHKSVNLSFIITNIKNKLTDLCGN